jgi:neutral ceramidase
LLPGGALNQLWPLVAQRVPVQLLRIGPLYLIGMPGEVTITAGLRLRRAVAKIVEADLHDVLVAGYSNGYIHYVTTPEEYEEQRYEGASTLFGRWELPALVQAAAGLATAMREGVVVDPGPATADLSHRQRVRDDRTAPDSAPPGASFGAVVVAPRPGYRAGERVSVVFVGAHPNNDLHRGGTYLEVQRQSGEEWHRVHDDGDWETRFVWKRVGGRASEVTVSWDIPLDAVAGQYRIRYHGDARDGDGTLHPFTGETPSFAVDGDAHVAG